MSDLEKVARHHNYWCSIVSGFGCNPSVVEDIVQEMYIKINRKLTEGINIDYGEDDVNKLYIYRTLWSIFMDYKRAKSKSIFCEISDEEGNESLLNSLETETGRSAPKYSTNWANVFTNL